MDDIFASITFNFFEFLIVKLLPRTYKIYCVNIPEQNKKPPPAYI